MDGGGGGEESGYIKLIYVPLGEGVGGGRYILLLYGLVPPLPQR
jgi:hypothetical protein